MFRILLFMLLPFGPQSSTELLRIIAPDPGPDEGFGGAEVSDGTLIVSAPGDDDQGNDRGSAYIYQKVGSAWVFEAKLLASDGQPGDLFGRADVEGSIVVVGAMRADNAGLLDSGAAYVFERNGTTWTETQKLTSPVANSGDLFGSTVSIDGDTVIIGSSHFAGQAGAAYLLVRSQGSWNHLQRLEASDAQASDLFGTWVDLSGDVAVVGAPGVGGGPATGAGAAYVFRRNVSGAWVEEDKLVASNPADTDFFGASVAVSGDVIVVGAPCKANPHNKAGAAYVFQRVNMAWTQTRILNPMNPHTLGRFGSDVAIEGRIILCGYPSDDVGASDSGSCYAYLLDGSNVIFDRKLVPSIPGANLRLGGLLSINDTVVAVSAPGDDSGGRNTGATYIYEVYDTIPVSYCNGKMTSQGCVPFVSWIGTPSISSGPFWIQSNDHVEGQSALLLYSFKKGGLAFHGGTLCVKAPFQRVLTLVKAFDGVGCMTCAGNCRTLQRNFNQQIQSGQDPMLTAGQRVNVQWRQRDPNDLLGFGDALSNGLSFVIGS